MGLLMLQFKLYPKWPNFVGLKCEEQLIFSSVTGVKTNVNVFAELVWNSKLTF